MPSEESSPISSAGKLDTYLQFAIFNYHSPLTRNYNHVANLWQHEKWLPGGAVQQAKAHYGGYSIKRQDGLRVITLNTDMCMGFLV